MTCRGRGNEGNSEALLVIYVILVEVLSQMVSLLDCCIFVMLNGTNTMLFFLINSELFIQMIVQSIQKKLHTVSHCIIDDSASFLLEALCDHFP